MSRVAGNLSYTKIFIPKPIASRITSTPIRPKPITPIVFPLNSIAFAYAFFNPLKLESPSKGILRLAWCKLRTIENKCAITNSATD